MDVSVQRKNPRLGCLGSIIAFALLGTLAVLMIDGLFAPWGFYLGGHLHILPYWRGWGRMHTASSGDYLVFVSMWPAPGKYYAHMTGTGELCTPRGERITLRVGADMDKHIGSDMQGKAIRIYMYHRPYLAGLNTNRRPRIDLHGQWQNPNIVLNDRGTLLTEFKPDGTLYPDGKEPARNEVVQITLKDGSRDDYSAACAALKR